MNWYWYLYGFFLGTFKFVPSHWALYLTAKHTESIELNFFEIYLSTSFGAIICMTVFYFSATFFMQKAFERKKIKWAIYQTKLKRGQKIKRRERPKKNFTRINKLLVKVKLKIGFHIFIVVTVLFLSIPLGSIICAKFYKHQKKTFPFMLSVVFLYSLLMTSLIKLI